MTYTDVLVIGAGPGGLAAASEAAGRGARTVVFERSEKPGGILGQCIHDGFGLVRFAKQLTGPEYAARSLRDAELAGVRLVTGTIVTDLAKDDDGTILVTAVSPGGMRKVRAGAVVLATGCRERTRGMIGIPGPRPAGIYTAGAVQNLVNVRNIMAGRKVVILGTGDIGLIMARRLTLEGAEVVCAIEMQSDVCGLSRNVRQCLQDYRIPVYLSHTVTDIIGRDRLEAVEMSPVDASGRPDRSKARRIGCDTLILSVGLIPENEVAETAGIVPDPATNVLVTDENLMTEMPGIFACGNCKGIMDLADYVSAEGAEAGRNAAAYVLGEAQAPSAVCGVNTSPKGMPAPGTVTCTFCPKGCTLDLSGDEITGNGCERGLEFAEAELTDPVRILTTTVRIGGARGTLPVRSDGFVLLREMKDIVRQIGSLEVKGPVKAGQVLMGPVGSTGINIVSQCDLE